MRNWFLVSFLIIMIFPILLFAQGRVLIKGEYSYTYGGNETLVEAKHISYSMALRNAIETYHVFVASTSTLKDYGLISDIIQTIASGYLEDIKVISQSLEGRTVVTKIQAYVVPKDAQRIIAKRVHRALRRSEVVIDRNQCLEIINTKKLSYGGFRGNISDLYDEELRIIAKADKDASKISFIRKVEVIVKAVCDVDPSNNSPLCRVGINYFDVNGDPMGGLSGTPSHRMIPGQIGAITFVLPDNVKSYKVFLAKE